MLIQTQRNFGRILFQLTVAARQTTLQLHDSKQASFYALDFVCEEFGQGKLGGPTSTAEELESQVGRLNGWRQLGCLKEPYVWLLVGFLGLFNVTSPVTRLVARLSQLEDREISLVREISLSFPLLPTWHLHVANLGFPIAMAVSEQCMLSCFSCLILCSPRDCSPPSSSVPGILQTRILECKMAGSSTLSVPKGPGGSYKVSYNLALGVFQNITSTTFH